MTTTPSGLTHHSEGDTAAVSTPGARRHATQEEILLMANRLLRDDWGAVNAPADVNINQQNRQKPDATVMGVYMASDGTILYAVQHHRDAPPLVLHPEERRQPITAMGANSRPNTNKSRDHRPRPQSGKSKKS